MKHKIVSLVIYFSVKLKPSISTMRALLIRNFLTIFIRYIDIVKHFNFYKRPLRHWESRDFSISKNSTPVEYLDCWFALIMLTILLTWWVVLCSVLNNNWNLLVILFSPVDFLSLSGIILSKFSTILIQLKKLIGR